MCPSASCEFALHLPACRSRIHLVLDAASKVLEQEWREKAKKDLEEWNLRQNEQMERNRANNRYAREETASCPFLPPANEKYLTATRMSWAHGLDLLL